jgi:hypothetical protein
MQLWACRGGWASGCRLGGCTAWLPVTQPGAGLFSPFVVWLPPRTAASTPMGSLGAMSHSTRHPSTPPLTPPHPTPPRLPTPSEKFLQARRFILLYDGTCNQTATWLGRVAGVHLAYARPPLASPEEAAALQAFLAQDPTWSHRHGTRGPGAGTSSGRLPGDPGACGKALGGMKTARGRTVGIGPRQCVGLEDASRRSAIVARCRGSVRTPPATPTCAPHQPQCG